MKCYYEELGLERDVSESEIKTAYRRLALKWHPDKNPDCMEIAKERFQLIQQAYEVLSDPQERAWYDNHREQILRGKNSNYEDNCLNVFQYFTVSCFKGYGDDENGFYSVYREVFNKISAEDAEFMESEDLLKIPCFGDSKSSYEDVVGPFYAYWSAYCTKRSYAWLCPYDVREIKDRRILREIDKEMKKIVQNAKKERNEEVRNLVSFVRKRDKRVQEFKRLLEERTALNRQKQEKNRLEQLRRRQEELNEIINNRKETSKNNDYEEQLKQLELEYSSDDEFYEDEPEDVKESEGNDYNDSLYCVACNKEFKTEKSFANHELSRKHRDNVQRLKMEMEIEDNSYQKEGSSIKDEETITNREESREHHDNEEEFKIEISEDNCYQKADGSFKDGEDSRALLKHHCNNSEHMLSRSEKKGKLKNKKESETTKPDELEERSKIGELNEAALKESDDSSEDWDTKNKKGSRKNKKKSRTSKTKTSLFEEIAQTKTQPITKSGGDNCTLKSDTIQHVCATCNSNFESKNKLFSHLKLTNHAVFIPNAKLTNNEQNKMGKNKSRKRN